MRSQYDLRETQESFSSLTESDTTHPTWLRRQRGEKQWEGNGVGACGQLRAHKTLGRGAKANQEGFKTLRVLLPHRPRSLTKATWSATIVSAQGRPKVPLELGMPGKLHSLNRMRYEDCASSQ